MSVSIAHELNQPLGAILSNAQAARLFLDQEPAPLDEVREGLDAVIRNDQRAGEIVQALRTMLVKGEVPKQRRSDSKRSRGSCSSFSTAN